jgi:hypothetical protein
MCTGHGQQYEQNEMEQNRPLLVNTQVNKNNIYQNEVFKSEQQQENMKLQDNEVS